jgi:hypothetical protein
MSAENTLRRRISADEEMDNAEHWTDFGAQATKPKEA